MAASFSHTAYQRLPVAVRKMPKEAQTVCIYLRLRKSEETIRDEMALPPGEVSRLIAEVKRTLIVNGNYDIIADPSFVPLDEADGAAEEGPGMEERVMARAFLRALGDALESLTRDERRLLHLFFERRMTAAEIAAFLKGTGVRLESGGAAVAGPAEVFAMIDRAVKNLLDAVSETTPIGRGTLTVKGLKDVLYQTGVDA